VCLRSVAPGSYSPICYFRLSMFSTIWGICVSLKANLNSLKTSRSSTVVAQAKRMFFVDLKSAVTAVVSELATIRSQSSPWLGEVVPACGMCTIVIRASGLLTDAPAEGAGEGCFCLVLWWDERFEAASPTCPGWTLCLEDKSRRAILLLFLGSAYFLHAPILPALG
jgi:hypothetical protein